LWSAVPYTAGGHVGYWDGTTDTGQVAAEGEYHVRVLRSQASYVWDGVVGNSTVGSSTANPNTMAASTGPGVFNQFETIASMAVVETQSGPVGYIAAGYQEGD